MATAWMLREMASRNMAPLALLLNWANPIIAQGAAFGAVPLVDRFEADITGLIQTGEDVDIDPSTGQVTLSR